MSLKFYQPVTKGGIIDLIYANTDSDTTSYPLAEVTRDVNLAKDALIMRAIKASGKWQVDDTGHTDYNIITCDLTENQRDISFTTDEGGNLILDIYRVMVADSSGIFHDLKPVDQQNKDEDTLSMVDGSDTTGIPTKYDKTANGIFFNVLPSYSYTNGIKIFINREGLHYSVPTEAVADDTITGIDPRLDEYLAIRPSYYYAFRKGLKQTNFLANELLKYEGDENKGITGLIEFIYSKRTKDEKTQIIPKYRSSR